MTWHTGMAKKTTSEMRTATLARILSSDRNGGHNGEVPTYEHLSMDSQSFFACNQQAYNIHT